MTSEAGRRPPVPPFARRGAVAVVGAVGVVFALALGLQLWRWAAVEREPPTGDAEWIWTEVPRYRSTPVAFWAAADFELSEPPAAAELLALGDEEYVLFLNGRRVGSNVYTPGAPLDVYQVGPLLRPGANRLAKARGGGVSNRRGRDSCSVAEPLTGIDWRSASISSHRGTPCPASHREVSWSTPVLPPADGPSLADGLHEPRSRCSSSPCWLAS